MNEFLEINLLLDDIKEYVNSVLIYLTETNSNLDIEEIIMYLSSVPESIETIKELLLKN